MNAATLEDLLVLTYVRSKNHSLPKKTLYIALDPWMIEVSNGYADWLQISVPDYFVSSVAHFGFDLPTNSQKRFFNLSKRRGDSRKKEFSTAFGNRSVSSKNSGAFTEMMSGEAPESGVFPITFIASISTGTYNWAWQIRQNGKLVQNGTYMDVGEDSISPHEKRMVFVNGIDMKEGDIITLEMSHANNDGDIIAQGNQKYLAKKLSIIMSCDDPKAKKYSFFSRFECDLPSERYIKNIYKVIRELVSPAYFQNSLKKITLKYEENKSASQIIRSVEACENSSANIGYIFCSDGSVPRPKAGSVDPAEVYRIVTTIDDGLVPLKVLDEGALNLLADLTSYFTKLDIAVKYLLVPVHPHSFEKWKAENDSRGFIKAEKIYKVFAAKRNIPLFGSYDPKAMGCTGDDFRDWVHPLPSCSNRVASAAQEEL